MESKDQFRNRIQTGTPLPLGASYKDGCMNFAVAAEGGQPCALVLYHKDETHTAFEIPFPVESRSGNVYSLAIRDFKADDYEYNFRIGRQIVPDPYAKRILGREHFGVPVKKEDGGFVRCGFAVSDYDWKADQPLAIPYENVIMYGLHVRNFTMHPSSKIKHKGTFLGIREKIPYLKEMGINHIELMPSYEFDEILIRRPAAYYADDTEKTKESFRLNTWGYGPGSYFAPKASYAASADPVTEFKDMVRALHENGIEISMEFYFPKGTGVELMLRCLRYWVLSYHLDGIHLNGEDVPACLLASDPILSRTKLMYQGFPVEEIYQEGALPEFKNLAEYNSGFLVDARRFLKGDEDMLDAFTWRARRNPSGHGVINYITNHDGFTLLDLVSYDGKHNEENEEDNRDGTNYNYSWNCGAEGPSRKRAVRELRVKQVKNAFSFLMLSQGTPYIFSGDELMHTKKGNNNSYCQDNGTAWINWNLTKDAREVRDYVKKLIALRREHPILHRPEELRIMDYMACGYPDLSYHGKKAWYGEFEPFSRQIGLMYCGKYAKTGQQEDDFFYVAYNMHWIEHEFALPKLPDGKSWRLVMDTSLAVDGSFYESGREPVVQTPKMIPVKARTVMVLIGK
ncbi:hypothetical protein [Diplocloster hominis]|uniref:hypothetical protein n=1 Tax=Diplocloster hominis TaxID=3079010 RepID=UPI0031BA60B4